MTDREQGEGSNNVIHVEQYYDVTYGDQIKEFDGRSTTEILAISQQLAKARKEQEKEQQDLRNVKRTIREGITSQDAYMKGIVTNVDPKTLEHLVGPAKKKAVEKAKTPQLMIAIEKKVQREHGDIPNQGEQTRNR